MAVYQAWKVLYCWPKKQEAVLRAGHLKNAPTAMLVMEKDNPLNKTEEPALPHVTKSAAIAASGLVVNINLLVATIIASITFAAAIQVPGGYDGTTGLANLRNKTSFKFFIAYDALAFSFPAASTLDLSRICSCIQFPPWWSLPTLPSLHQCWLLSWLQNPCWNQKVLRLSSRSVLIIWVTRGLLLALPSAFLYASF